MGQMSRDQRVQIGSYLRQQRLRLDGRLHGPAKDRRHVAHLTQADLAELAGVSEALIAQIETGRYVNLNERVLARLGSALRFNASQETYLRNLLVGAPGDHPHAAVTLTSGTRSVVDSAMPVPSFVSDCCFNLLYWNPALVAMLGDFANLPLADRNVIWSMFRDPAMRRNWVDWEGNARNLVAALRMQRSMFPHRQADFDALIARLLPLDAQFAAWWETTEPDLHPVRDKDYLHPVVGRLRLFQTATSVLGTPDLAIVHMTPRDDETRARLEALARHQAARQPASLVAASSPRRAAD